MSRIDEMLQRLSPDGVEFVPLGELVRIRNGRDYKHLSDGNIPVYGSGGVMTYVNASAYDGPSVLIPRKGSLNNVFFVDVPFWTVDTIFYTEIGGRLEPKYLYYLLKKLRLGSLNQAAGVPSQTQKRLNKLRIPAPPLEIQREIVGILDQFTQLEAELEAELEARRRQFGCYSRTILAQTGYESTSLRVGDLCTVSRGAVISKTYLEEHPGPYSVYSSQTQNGGVFGCIDSYEVEDESITWTTDGANAGSVFYHLGERYSLTNVCGLLRVRDTSQIRAKYLYYELRECAPYAVSIGMGNPKLMAAQMREVRVPVPSVEKQEHAIRQLDALSSLEVDASVGLPAEIAARRKQYEYYRDKLLTFEKKV